MSFAIALLATLVALPFPAPVLNPVSCSVYHINQPKSRPKLLSWSPAHGHDGHRTWHRVCLVPCVSARFTPKGVCRAVMKLAATTLQTSPLRGRRATRPNGMKGIAPIRRKLNLGAVPSRRWLSRRAWQQKGTGGDTTELTDQVFVPDFFSSPKAQSASRQWTRVGHDPIHNRHCMLAHTSPV